MVPFNQEHKDLIFGSLLGDGNLSTETQGRTWRFRVGHAETFKPYTMHKYDILKPYCGSPPILNVTEPDPRTGKIYKRWTFNTLVADQLKFYGDMFYRYNPKTQRFEKDAPSLNNIKKNLTPRALCYLYMDDGAIKSLGHSNGMRICTERFSIEGVTRIQTALRDLYGLNVTLTKKVAFGEERKRISILEKDSTTFRNLIQPYLVDRMKYKVSDGNRGHL